MSTEPTPRPNHDSNGQFARRKPGGPGNPYARKVAALRQALIDSITAADIAEVGQAMLKQARKGNVPAARLVYSYTLGKPTHGVDPDRLNVDEWQQLRDEAAMTQEMPALIQSVPPELTLDFVKG